MKQAAVAVPRTVWVLGAVSLCMDLSSEIIHALLPLFLTGTLGVSVAVVGAIDGVAEATASITKVFSGYLSDRFGKRKPLILLGYGLAALSKPLFAVAGSAPMVFGARFADRIGKGLRGAPRDALIAEVTPPAIRGKAFGLRQSLDTTGAFAGPLLAIGLMILFTDDIRTVFWLATIPAVVAVILVVFGVEEAVESSAATPGVGAAALRPLPSRPSEVARGDSVRPSPAVAARSPIRLRDLGQLDRAFWAITTIGVAFTLARFSEAFLILKASAEGLPLTLAPLVLVVMNLVYAIGAYPAGMLSDRAPSRSVLATGMTCLVLADLSLALLPGLSGAMLGIVLWGAHMALTQGLMAKLVADTARSELLGSAYGLFNLATGITLLLASLIAGLVWDSLGADATFLVGAAFSLVALALLALLSGGLSRDRDRTE